MPEPVRRSSRLVSKGKEAIACRRVQIGKIPLEQEGDYIQVLCRTINGLDTFNGKVVTSVLNVTDPEGGFKTLRRSDTCLFADVKSIKLVLTIEDKEHVQTLRGIHYLIYSHDNESYIGTTPNFRDKIRQLLHIIYTVVVNDNPLDPQYKTYFLYLFALCNIIYRPRQKTSLFDKAFATATTQNNNTGLLLLITRLTEQIQYAYINPMVTCIVAVNTFYVEAETKLEDKITAHKEKQEILEKQITQNILDNIQLQTSLLVVIPPSDAKSQEMVNEQMVDAIHTLSSQIEKRDMDVAETIILSRIHQTIPTLDKNILTDADLLKIAEIRARRKPTCKVAESKQSKQSKQLKPTKQTQEPHISSKQDNIMYDILQSNHLQNVKHLVLKRFMRVYYAYFIYEEDIQPEKPPIKFATLIDIQLFALFAHITGNTIHEEIQKHLLAHYMPTIPRTQEIQAVIDVIYYNFLADKKYLDKNGDSLLPIDSKTSVMDDINYILQNDIANTRMHKYRFVVTNDIITNIKTYFNQPLPRGGSPLTPTQFNSLLNDFSNQYVASLAQIHPEFKKMIKARGKDAAITWLDQNYKKSIHMKNRQFVSDPRFRAFRRHLHLLFHEYLRTGLIASTLAKPIGRILKIVKKMYGPIH